MQRERGASGRDGLIRRPKDAMSSRMQFLRVHILCQRVGANSPGTSETILLELALGYNHGLLFHVQPNSRDPRSNPRVYQARFRGEESREFALLSALALYSPTCDD